MCESLSLLTESTSLNTFAWSSHLCRWTLSTLLTPWLLAMIFCDFFFLFNFSWVITKSLDIKEKIFYFTTEETTLLSSVFLNLCLILKVPSLGIIYITLPQSFLTWWKSSYFIIVLPQFRNVFQSFAYKVRLSFCPMISSQDIIYLPSHFLKE